MSTLLQRVKKLEKQRLLLKKDFKFEVVTSSDKLDELVNTHINSSTDLIILEIIA